MNLHPMKFLRRWYQRQRARPRSYSLIDIGRAGTKAVVVLIEPGNPTPQIIGFGQADTEGRDIVGGRLEAAAVVEPVNQALTLAEDCTEATLGRKVVPDDVIFAIAGPALTGQRFTVKQPRPTPTKPISKKEIKQLQYRAERVAARGLAKLKIGGVRSQALAVNDAGLRVDDQFVLDGVGLTGQEITLSLFGVAVQTSAPRALTALAGELDVTVTNLVAAPQALVSLIPHNEAVVLDVGSSGTTICLIQDDALVGTNWVPFGGEFFTQSLAQAVEMAETEAERLKRAWGNSELAEDEAAYLAQQLTEVYRRWFEAVRTAGREVVSAYSLPWKVYLTGGGSLLPGLVQVMRSYAADFERSPDISRLSSTAVWGVDDLTGSLDYNFFALATGLAVGLPL